MKVGGNTAATEFFAKHGSGAQLNTKDAKVKYTSKAALLYKDKLVEKAKLDAIEYVAEFLYAIYIYSTNFLPNYGLLDVNMTRLYLRAPSAMGSRIMMLFNLVCIVFIPYGNRNPDLIIGEHEEEKAPASPTTSTAITTSTATSTSATAAAADDDDFFSNWDKPKTPAATTAARQVPSRTTNSSLRAKTTVSGASARTGGASKPMKLGAKKAGVAINFEEAEARAREEQERAAKLGYNSVEEAAEAEHRAGEERESQFSNRLVYYEPNSATTGGAAGKGTQQQAEDFERMGIGMSRLGFGAMPTAGAGANTGGASSQSRWVHKAPDG